MTTMDTITITSAAMFLLFLFCFHIPQTQAQQPYVNNKQLDCDNHYNVTDGNVCNGVNKSCLSYLTFKSAPPQYNTPPNIAFLLNSSASLIAAANNISDVDPIPADTLVIVPVECSCSGNGKYYQHNASYTLKSKDETYFSVANNTYGALTTCQAMIAQNPYDIKKLVVGLNLEVPLRCACPTSKQVAAGFKYLLTYLVSEGESIEGIGGHFGVDEQSVKDANELTGDLIFFFTNIMVPLRDPPSKIQNGVSPPPPPPPPPPTPAAPAGDEDSSSSKKWVIVGVTVGAALFVLIGLLIVFLCLYRRRRSELPVAKPVLASHTEATKSSDYANTTESWALSSEGIRYAIDSLTVYKFEELQNATNFFSEANKIKGSVYKASFKGDSAAVKVLKGDVSDEINILKRINHTNIIRLSGFCVYKGNTYLVYEFAENGSLDNWLHSKKYENSMTLNWKQRVQIAYDVADALNYLHNYTNPVHIHKNLNSGNVLLDANFRAKVSNFGLARAMGDGDEEGEFQLTRHVIGTKGYMPPEYLENGVITPKMDVFALGVVILELLSGIEAIVGDTTELERMLSASVVEVLDGDNVREKLRAFTDATLRNEYPFDLAYSMAQIAKRCVARDLNSRPTIADVFMALSKIHSSTLDWDPSDEYERSGFASQVSLGR